MQGYSLRDIEILTASRAWTEILRRLHVEREAILRTLVHYGGTDAQIAVMRGQIQQIEAILALPEVIRREFLEDDRPS